MGGDDIHIDRFGQIMILGTICIFFSFPQGYIWENEKLERC